MHDGGAPLWADEGRLVQVFSNLLTNAAKFTPSEGRITVRSEDLADEVLVEVQDTGRGMDAEFLTRAFEPFVQSDGARMGLGLGLAIVRGLIHEHGGRVEASSLGTGQGSTFRVFLPKVPVQERAVSRLPEAIVDLPVVTGRRVLIVDDNEDAADLLARYLRARGHTVRVVYNPLEALELTPAFRADFALLDIGLPLMDGYELASEMRRKGMTETRFVPITGYAQARSDGHADDTDFEAHLVKPISLTLLDTLLASAPNKTDH